MAKLRKLSNRQLLTYFMEASREQVFSTFAGLPRAEREDGFVFIPGTDPPERRVLLVAHADTVFDDKKYNKIIVYWDGNIATAGGSNGLGADDRAGCSMLWLMRNTGASLLITDEEESGCVGARKAVDSIGDRLKEHIFAVQMDRRGDQQAVFYNAATEAFRKWLVDEQLGGDWREERGSFSDVAEICPQVGLNGVNLSAGFLFEHRSSEMLFLDAWYRSVNATRRLVTWAQETTEFPEWGKPAERRRYVGSAASWGWTEEDEKQWQARKASFAARDYGGGSSYYATKRANGHTVACVCAYCKETYYDRSVVRRHGKSQQVHSEWCGCLDCRRARETAEVKQLPSGNGNGAGQWRAHPTERGWKVKELGNGAEVYALWDGNPATLQDDPKTKAEVIAEVEQGKEAAGDGDEAPFFAEGGGGSDRSQMAALLLPEWEDLTEKEQESTRNLAEKLAIGLVRSQRIDVDTDDFDAAESFYEMIVLPAYHSGLVSDYDAAIWESRCLFNHDSSDPRIEGFYDGCIAGFVTAEPWDA